MAVAFKFEQCLRRTSSKENMLESGVVDNGCGRLDKTKDG